MPPAWLALFIALAWVQSSYFGLGLHFGGGWADFVGGLLVGGGIIIVILAAIEFRRYRTTIVPKETPARLIQSSVFKRSRNPIYLADAMILAGLILRWDAVLSLPLVPVFVWLIEKRFILGEEARMRQIFRMEYAKYERKVRRWL
ncbi:isoprenylcysteine carboxylmethyltransferase family protein [Roseovarius faecimaris]|uniref:Isoprenylcysteine carboxylmethyltransferase family protein n=2 Tax=Roseovarius faecimaris TaxID=2494550 RepID=A0A6I6IY30_9RHOB|nr:isoprenylcysteine carboxylmethyltransferase family protein [Roseovarius faecimaris]